MINIIIFFVLSSSSLCIVGAVRIKIIIFFFRFVKSEVLDVVFFLD